MNKILIFLISLVVGNSVYSADDFFEKKPSILIKKDDEIQNAYIGNKQVDFFELSNQQKINRTNQLFKQATRDKDVLFQTSNMSDYDKAQYSRENKFSNSKGYSPHIESIPNRQIISEEEYQKEMEEIRKTRYVERNFLF